MSIIKQVIFLNDQNVVVGFKKNQHVGTVSLEDLPLKDPVTGNSKDYRMFLDTVLFNVVEVEPGVYEVSPKTDQYTVIEFDEFNIPSNEPVFGYTYDNRLNNFIPPCPVNGFILDEQTLEWKPDLSRTYDLHGDGKMYRYDEERSGWVPT